MSVAVRKIIVDSRAFLNNAPASLGIFELPEDIQLYGNEALYLQSFHCVASWLSVDSTNDTMYLVEFGTTTVNRTIMIPDAAYDADSLATQLQNELNGSGKTVSGTYTVTRVVSSNPDVVTSASATARLYTISLSGGKQFWIPDDSYLEDPNWYANTWLSGGGAAYNVANPPSTNELFSFPGPFADTSLTSTLVDLRSKHALYMHSTTIGEMGSMGSTGAMRTCIAVMPVIVGYGCVMIYLGSGNPHDFIEPGTRSLKRLSLEIRSSSGDLVDFQGGRYIAVFVVGTKP
jgi:hypothetical protein